MQDGGRTVAIEPEHVVREAARQPTRRHAAVETVPPADLSQEVVGQGVRSDHLSAFEARITRHNCPATSLVLAVHAELLQVVGFFVHRAVLR